MNNKQARTSVQKKMASHRTGAFYLMHAIGTEFENVNAVFFSLMKHGGIFAFASTYHIYSTPTI